jgi:hypothetical protein
LELVSDWKWVLKIDNADLALSEVALHAVRKGYCWFYGKWMLWTLLGARILDILKSVGILDRLSRDSLMY